MAKLIWDETGERFYETGIDHGVVYPIQTGGLYSLGVCWNGLTSVTESPSGAEASPIYADNMKYFNMVGTEEFGGTIEAYNYPDEFEECNGGVEPVDGMVITQQARKTFGLCYRTILGNDTDGNSYGYKLHLVYGCIASPSQKAYQTVTDNPEPATMSWEFKTTPVNMSGYKPVSHLEIDSTKVTPAKLTALEDILYGTEAQEPRLPLPDEVKTTLAS